MIKHKQNILIHSDINKVWFFLNDLSRSLIFDKYYKKIEIPSNYSINKQLHFYIHSKYLHQVYKLKAEIISCNPPEHITLRMSNKDYKVYNHTKTFMLEQMGSSTLLKYKNIGSFHSIILDTLFYLLIKSSCNNEIEYLKKAIESSDIYYDSKEYKPATSYKL